jgi:hypothetical protein
MRDFVFAGLLFALAFLAADYFSGSDMVRGLSQASILGGGAAQSQGQSSGW